MRDVSVREADAAARLVLRCRDDVAGLAGVLGFALPQRVCGAVGDGRRSALKLGPDEWLLLAPEADGAALAAGLELALARVPHALVDVGHRQCGLAAAGPRVADLLNAGCPLDLGEAAFPVGMATRTVLGKAEVVLWRTAADGFRIEVWRSFAPYVRRFLAEAALEFGPAEVRP